MLVILRKVVAPLLLAMFPITLVASELNVMTFNIRYDNRGDGQNQWRFRADNVAKMFATHDVAVAGLQEALHHQLLELKKRLPQYEAVGVGREDGKQKGEYGPIFYRKDRLVLERYDTIWLSKTPERPGSKSWDSSLPRIATLAWFKEKNGEQRWLIANTHFDHRGAEARRESAKLIAHHVRKVRYRDQLPAVVMGDLNCLPNSEPYKNLQRGGFKDALLESKAKHVGPMSSWNGFGKAVVPGRRIDFIFVDAHLKVLSHKIDASQFKGRFPSDHCPVITRLSHP